MLIKSAAAPKSWLAFELNVLRRLKFTSVALPFADEPHLGAYLKRWNARVTANDLTKSAWTKAIAAIQNNTETLSDEDVNLALEDAYVPRYRLQNETLKNWFNETDAWWFDNVRNNIEKIASPTAHAIALSVGMSVGDYALSFADETRELRQPLSAAFKRLWSVLPEPINNNQINPCQNRTPFEFLAENRETDLMFLRLPQAHKKSLREFLGWSAWREEWLRGGDGFWNDLETAQSGRLGALVETKYQYLRHLEEILQTASHFPMWAIAHVEDGFIATQEIVETIARIRRVDTIFTKDFTELTGTKAVIITA